MSTRHLTDSAHLDGPALDARHEAARVHDFALSELLGAEILIAKKEHNMGNVITMGEGTKLVTGERAELLQAFDAYVVACTAYEAGEAEYSELRKAADHLCIVRDRMGASYFRVVRVEAA